MIYNLSLGNNQTKTTEFSHDFSEAKIANKSLEFLPSNYTISIQAGYNLSKQVRKSTYRSEEGSQLDFLHSLN